MVHSDDTIFRLPRYVRKARHLQLDEHSLGTMLRVSMGIKLQMRDVPSGPGSKVTRGDIRLDVTSGPGSKVTRGDIRFAEGDMCVLF